MQQSRQVLPRRDRLVELYFNFCYRIMQVSGGNDSDPAVCPANNHPGDGG